MGPAPARPLALERTAREAAEQRDLIRATVGERWLAAIVSATGSTAFDATSPSSALRAVGATPRPSLVVLAYVAAAFLEARLVATLTLAGVRPSHALVATLLYRLIAFWLPIPIGGFAFTSSDEATPIAWRSRRPPEAALARRRATGA